MFSRAIKKNFSHHKLQYLSLTHSSKSHFCTLLSHEEFDHKTWSLINIGLDLFFLNLSCNVSSSNYNFSFYYAMHFSRQSQVP